MANQNIKKFYQHSDKQYYYLPHAIGHGAPTTVPQDAGLMYIDVDSQTIYVSAGKSQVSDWKVVTGGGSGIDIQVNSASNPDQSYLNLVPGPGISVQNTGPGDVTFSNDNQISKIAQMSLSNTIVSTPGDGTYIDVAAQGLILNIQPEATCAFRAVIAYDVDNTSVGLTWALNGNDPDLANASINYYSYGSGGTIPTFLITTGNSTFNQPTNITGQTPNLEGNVAVIEGVYKASNNVNLTIVPSVRDDGGAVQNITVKKGSYIEYLTYSV